MLGHLFLLMHVPEMKVFLTLYTPELLETVFVHDNFSKLTVAVLLGAKWWH